MFFKKKLILFAMAALLMFLLIGCAKTKAPASASNNQQPVTADAETQSPEQAQEQTEDLQPELEKKYYRKDDGQGGVEVQALWITQEFLQEAVLDDKELKKQVDSNLVFEIFMTTHGGNLLKEFDFANNVELLVDGRKVKPLKWSLNEEDGHHPSGMLIFPNTVESRPIIGEDTKELTLIVKNLRKVPERYLTWEL